MEKRITIIPVRTTSGAGALAQKYAHKAKCIDGIVHSDGFTKGGKNDSRDYKLLVVGSREEIESDDFADRVGAALVDRYGENIKYSDIEIETPNSMKRIVGAPTVNRLLDNIELHLEVNSHIGYRRAA